MLMVMKMLSLTVKELWT